MRFTCWFTGRGDSGTTDLLAGKRVCKSHPIIAALGDIDELSARIGCCRALMQKTSDEHCILKKCQMELISLMGALASGSDFTGSKSIDEVIENLDKKITMPKSFILPGNNHLEAELNLTRTICRRAERSVVIAKASNNIISYLNRLSTLLFMLTINAGNEE